MPDLLTHALSALRRAAPGGFLVGGCVRDWLLGRPLKDLDIVVPVEAEEPGALLAPPSGQAEAARPQSIRIQQVGRAVAGELGGAFFWLREGMGVARVVVRGEPALQIDVVPLASSLEEDLRRRDFTINAMAVRVVDGLAPGAPILDPTGGREDLAARRLCLASPDALEQDPLRCLRAYRFRAVLALTFSPALPEAIRAAGPGLRRVSGERIRDELFALLESHGAVAVVAELLDHDLVRPWCEPLAVSSIGQADSASDRLSSIPSGLTVASSLERWLRQPPDRLAGTEDLTLSLHETVTPPRSRRALTTLAALAIRAGKAVADVTRALALSGEETRVLKRAVGGALSLASEIPHPGCPRLRFWQQWEPGAVESVLLAIAAANERSRPAQYGGEPQHQPAGALEELLAEMLERRLRPKPPLLTGSEVMETLNCAPGPEVGRVLQEVEERRADGLVRSAEEARAWLEGKLQA